MEKQKYKIIELTRYYVQRYGLNTKYQSSTSPNLDDGLAPYRAQIERILKKKIFLEGKSLWDLIKTAKTPRQISLSDFERYCFPQWATYIRNHCGRFNEETLNADENRYLTEYAAPNPESEARTEYEETRNSFNTDDNTPIMTPEEINDYKRDMMIQALFELFFTPVDTKKLEADLYHRTYVFDTVYPSGEDKDTADRLAHPLGNYFHKRED